MADDPALKTDEELVADLPPRDGSANDPAARAESYLEDKNLDDDRAALEKLQKDLPSSGA
ncbi:MAG: hypothetical protein ACRDKY_11340 [Solirubrobacteraceae bacterium]